MTGDENYKVLPQSELSDGVITLRSLRQDDIENIRLWRNSQMDVLRQSDPISSEDQILYFEKHVWPEKKSTQPFQILLGIEISNKFIGYGGLVNIHWFYQRAEISFLLSDEIKMNKQNILTRFLLLIKELSFNHLGLKRIWTETYSNRKAHIKTLEASGFVLEGCMRKHVIVCGERTDSLIHGAICCDPDLGVNNI